jgi:hypothetical protein
MLKILGEREREREREREAYIVDVGGPHFQCTWICSNPLKGVGKNLALYMRH